MTNGVSNFAVSGPVPTIFTGTADQAAANVTFTLTNTYASGNTITLSVFPNGQSSNDCTTGNNIEFAATPTVHVSAGSGGETAPTITPTLGSSGGTGCVSPTNDDQVVLSFNSTASGAPGDTFAVTVSGIAYTVGASASTGPVVLDYNSEVATASNGSTGVSNATVLIKSSASAAANNPPVQVTRESSGSPGPLTVTESAAGQITGSICVTVASGAPFTFTSAGTASASTGSGDGTVGTATYTSSTILIPITTTSTAATTYTLSGVTVADGADTGPANVIVTTGGASCAAETTSVSTGLALFDSAPVLQPAIYGQDADATAIQEMAAALPDGGCPADNTVILATDQNFPDALAASYLAGELGTGILLTPTAQLSTETQTALENFGITQVIVVGGTLAISQNTINEVEATNSYPCGGPNAGPSIGKIQVTQVLAGNDQYGTAQEIDTTPPTTYVGKLNLSGAYAGQYNDTSGNESSTPEGTGALKTAIVATGTSFQDAAGASVLAYRDGLPLVLTDPNTLSTEASQTLQSLGIQQVIVLGGPLAISAADVTAIQALNISVIRIAGQDLTDTAQELAQFELQSTTGDAGLGWSTGWNNEILVARGDFYSDALAGCVLAYDAPTPLLLTLSPTAVGAYLTNFLGAGGSPAGIDGLGTNGNIQVIQPLGGPLALYATTLQNIVADVAFG